MLQIDWYYRHMKRLEHFKHQFLSSEYMDVFEI